MPIGFPSLFTKGLPSAPYARTFALEIIVFLVVPRELNLSRSFTVLLGFNNVSTIIAELKLRGSIS